MAVHDLGVHCALTSLGVRNALHEHRPVLRLAVDERCRLVPRACGDM